MTPKVKRRVLIKDLSGQCYYWFWFKQQKKEGSIYCGWPDFDVTRWGVIRGEGMIITTTPIGGVQKLTLHKSGVVKFDHDKKSDDPHRIEGYPLYNYEERTGGARHMFTCIVAQPKQVPHQNAPNGREGDITITTPVAGTMGYMFFAVPHIGEPPLQLHFKKRMTLDLESRIGDVMTMPNLAAIIPMLYHDIMCICYTSQGLRAAKPLTHVFYTEGRDVVMPLCDKPETGTLQAHILSPGYMLEGRDFTIKMELPLGLRLEGGMPK